MPISEVQRQAVGEVADAPATTGSSPLLLRLSLLDTVSAVLMKHEEATT